MTTLEGTTHDRTVVDLDLDDPRLGGGVVVGYDGSSPSVEALAWAADEAAARGTHLTVLHAADIGGELLGEAWVAVRDAAREKLAAVLDEVSQEPGAGAGSLDVRGALSLSGPAQTLVAASADADLVVIGNRGRGRVSSALLGSVALSVTAGAACPVVVVRGQVGRRAGPDHPVVLGVEGDHDPGPAVAFAAATAARHGADLVVIAACEGPEGLAGEDEASFPEDMIVRARTTSARAVDAALAAARTTAPGLQVRSRIVEADAAHALVQASADAGLVVVGGRGHGRIAGLLPGSIGHRVIHEAACPVAVVRHEDRPPDEDPEERRTTMTTQSAPIRQAAPDVTDTQHVVVGYDGSPDAVDALAWAAGEARQRGARLTVLSAAEVHDAWQGLPPILEGIEDAQRRVAQDGVERITTGDGELVVDAGVVLADPASALVAASADADLVVIGNRGRGRITGGLLGSVAFSVTTRAACPVVVVRGEPARRPGPDRAVVVGVQGPHGADAALAFAAQAAQRAGAPLVVLAAWTTPQVGGEGWTGDAYAQMVEFARRSAEIDADVALGLVQASHPRVEASARVIEAPAGSALADASAAAGLVVVGARGRGAAASLFLGSVSHAIVHASRCPVAVVRGGDHAQRGH